MNIKLMTGTNIKNGDLLLKGIFQDFSSWSDNLETVAHYYEGRVIEIDIKLDLESKMEYIREKSDIDSLNINPEDYNYGYIEVKYPVGATWYSFSKKYLEQHILEIKEIFPDMSKFEEE